LQVRRGVCVGIVLQFAHQRRGAACRRAGQQSRRETTGAVDRRRRRSDHPAHAVFLHAARPRRRPRRSRSRYAYWRNNNNNADQSGDDREISFLFQRLSVLIQRYNAILLHDCFVKEEEE